LALRVGPKGCSMIKNSCKLVIQPDSWIRAADCREPDARSLEPPGFSGDVIPPTLKNPFGWAGFLDLSVRGDPTRQACHGSILPSLAPAVHQSCYPPIRLSVNPIIRQPCYTSISSVKHADPLSSTSLKKQSHVAFCQMMMTAMTRQRKEVVTIRSFMD
jgi:hypothetical protein